jgi:hypothetical protein
MIAVCLRYSHNPLLLGALPHRVKESGEVSEILLLLLSRISGRKEPCASPPYSRDIDPSSMAA